MANEGERPNPQLERFLKLHRRYFDGLPKGPVLDFGAGEGEMLLAGAAAGFEIWGAEVSQGRFAQFAARAAGNQAAARFRLYDGETLPFDAGRFAAVHSWFVLEHVADVNAAVREIARVTAEGGAIMLFFQDARDAYDGHLDIPWPPYLPRALMRPYLEAFDATEADIAFLERTVFYTTSAEVVAALSHLGCEIVHESRPAPPRMLEALAVTTPEAAYALGQKVRRSAEAGSWARAPENGIVIARKRAVTAAKGCLAPGQQAAPARKFERSVLDPSAAAASLGDLGLVQTPVRPVPAKEQVKAFYDDHSGDRLRDFTKCNPRVEAAVAAIAEWAPPRPARVLEIGCGAGSTAWRMARAWPQAQVIGLDISEGSISLARRCFRRENLEFRAGEATPETTAGGPYDLVVMVDTFEHIAAEDRPALYAVLRARLAAEARIVVTVPTPEMLRHVAANVEGGLQPVDEDIDLPVILGFAEGVGAELVSYRKVGIWFYGDYAHFVLARRSPLADVALRRAEPSLGANPDLARRLGYAGERGLVNYLGVDIPSLVADGPFAVSKPEREALAAAAKP